VVQENSLRNGKSGAIQHQLSPQLALHPKPTEKHDLMTADMRTARHRPYIFYTYNLEETYGGVIALNLLLDMGEIVRTLQHRQGLQIACLKRLRSKWLISAEQARAAGERFKRNNCGRAILKTVAAYR
jgi:hypothetical protein